MRRPLALTLAALAAIAVLLLAWRLFTPPAVTPSAPPHPARDAQANVAAMEPSPDPAGQTRQEVLVPGDATPPERDQGMQPVQVRGVVVFADGRPVEGARVRLVANLSGPSPVFREAVADVRGTFTLTMPARGECHVNVEGTGALLEPRTTTLPQTGGEHELRIVVERPDAATTITGVVVDADGAPCADVNVSAIGEGFFGQTWTRADGTFAVARAAPRHDDGSSGVRVSAAVKGREQVEPGPDERVRWGQKDVRVVVRRLPGCWLVVRDPRGAPVADYDAFLLRALPRGGLAAQPMQRVSGATDGRVRLEALRLGRHVLFVRPWARDLDWRVIGPIAFDVTANGAPAEVLAQAALPGELRVRGNGAPTPEFSAELVLDVAGTPCNLDCLVTEFDSVDNQELRNVAWFTMAKGTADAGELLLRVPPGRYSLRARGEGLLPQLAVIDVPAGISTKVLEFERGGVLQGQLVPGGTLAALTSSLEIGAPVVKAQLLQGGPVPGPAPVALDGTFRLAPLPEGSCTLTLQYVTYLDLDAHPVAAPLGEVVIRAGQTIERQFDVRPCLPGTMTLQVRLDGAPLPNAQLFLRRAAPQWSGRANADQRGRVDKRLAPGEYDVLLAIAAQPGPGWHMLPLPDRLQVVAGGTHEYTVDARLRTMRIRLLDAAGEPVAGQRVKIEGQGQYFRVGGLSSDANGWVEIAPAPYGPFQLLLLGEGPQDPVRAGPFELRADHDRGQVEFRLR